MGINARSIVGADAYPQGTQPGGPWTCVNFVHAVGATLAVTRAVRPWVSRYASAIARRRNFFLFACPKRKNQRETTLGRGRLRFLPLPRPTLMETPKRGDPLLDLPRAVRIRPGGSAFPGFPRRAGTRASTRKIVLSSLQGRHGFGHAVSCFISSLSGINPIRSYSIWMLWRRLPLLLSGAPT